VTRVDHRIYPEKKDAVGEKGIRKEDAKGERLRENTRRANVAHVWGEGDSELPGEEYKWKLRKDSQRKSGYCRERGFLVYRGKSRRQVCKRRIKIWFGEGGLKKAAEACRTGRTDCGGNRNPWVDASGGWGACISSQKKIASRSWGEDAVKPPRRF